MFLYSDLFEAIRWRQHAAALTLPIRLRLERFERAVAVMRQPGCAVLDRARVGVQPEVPRALRESSGAGGSPASAVLKLRGEHLNRISVP